MVVVRRVSVPLAVLVLAGVLTVAGAIQASPVAAVEGGPDASHAAQICDSDTLDGSHLGGGNASSRFGSAWVPAGGSVTFKVAGEVLPSKYVGSGRAEYKFYVRVQHPGMATWENWNYFASGIQPGDPPYSWVPFSPRTIGTWTNTTGSSASFTVETWAVRTYAGAGVNWSVDLDVSAGARPPCELVWDEADVPNAAEPNECGTQPGAADPVNVVQGSFWDQWSDLAVAGRGPGLVLDRTYSSSRASVNGPFGYGWNWSYGMSVSEAAGIASVRQETGAVVRFAAANGGWVTGSRVNATLVKEPDGSWTFTRSGVEVFRFSSTGALTSVRDLSGNTTTLTYLSGQLASVTDSSGRSLTFTWLNGRITGVSGPAAVLATGSPAVPVAVAYGYGANGDLVSVTDAAGGVWTYGYDTQHRMVTVRDPRHHSLGGSAPVVENHYDASGRVDWQEDRLDRRTVFAYGPDQTTVTNPAGHVVRYEHARGICRAIVRNPGPDQSRWEFVVDEATLGRTKVTDPNGKVTTATYDDRGRRTSVNEAGRTTTITYTAQGLPATITDANNVTTTYTYDPGTDRLRTVSRPVTPGTGTATTTLNYGDAANPGLVTSVIDIRGKTWTMTYTAAGDLASATDPTAKKTTWVYNALGWPLSTVAPAGNAVGGVPGQHTTSTRYNARGQVVAITDPLGAVTEYDRDLSGNLTAQRDPVTSGVEQTSFTLNTAGELITVTRPGGTTLTTEYWPDGRLKTQRDGANAATSYAYDAQGRLTTVTDPAARVTTYRYDLGGRVASKQQPGGNCLANPKTACISYGYNTGDDLTTVDYSDPSTADVTFAYDNLHTRTGMTDATGASTWSWDSIGRLRSFSDPNGTVSYTYTDNGAGPTTVTYPGGKTVSRTYDDAGRQITSTGWTGGTATYGYDDNSNPTTTNTPATTGAEDTAAYDRANRMTAATIRQGTTVLASLGFGHDPEGMVTSTTGTGIAGAADAFTYGPFDQLATNSAGTFSYDSADNLSGFPDGRKQKFSAANELCYAATTNTPACGSAPAGAIRFDYDGRGNRIAQRPAGAVPTTMTYDQADRMTSARVPSQPDGSGQYHDMTSATVWYSTGESVVANQVKTYQITGANGIPATGVESVVLRLHVANPANYGGLTAFPAGGSANGTVAMYLNPGEAATNLAVSKLNGAGQVSVQTSAATVLSVELVGWYGNASAPGGFTFEPVAPARALEAALGAGSTTSVPVTGAYGVPSTGVSAVAVVAHSLGTAPSGYLTLYSGPTQPGSVTLLYDSGNSSALTIVPVGPDGIIKVHTTAATTAVLDVVGYYKSIESGDGNIAHTLTPTFIADTANHTGTCNGGTCNRLVANTPTTIDVTGVGGIPATGVASVAVVLQTYVPDAPGYITTHATGTAQPYAAAMVFDDAFTSTTAIVPVGTDGTITVISSTGVDLIVQTIGYFDAASKTYTYTYSGDGLRHSKTAPDGTVTKFTWDRASGLPLLLAEAIDGPGIANDRTVRYLYGPGGSVTSDITTMTTSGSETLRWYHQDQLGSTRALTSSSGAVLSTFSYSPFGTPGPVVGSATTPIGWAGEYRDPETGYIYLRARYYDPATAQFLTRDPLELVSRSAYGYADNNPINVTDPSGMLPGLGDIFGGIGDFFTGGGCGDGGLFGGITSAVGGFGDFVGDVGSLAWQYRDEIAFVAMVAGSFGTGGVFAVAFYGGFTLATASTATACARGQRAACAVGVISLVTGGAGRGLRNAGTAMTRAGNARTAASGIHLIQRTVTGPLLETVGGGASRTGAVSGRIGDGFGFTGLFL